MAVFIWRQGGPGWVGCGPRCGPPKAAREGLKDPIEACEATSKPSDSSPTLCPSGTEAPKDPSCDGPGRKRPKTTREARHGFHERRSLRPVLRKKSEPPVPAPLVKICFFVPLLHPLRKWSLRQTRRGSLAGCPITGDRGHLGPPKGGTGGAIDCAFGTQGGGVLAERHSIVNCEACSQQ